MQLKKIIKLEQPKAIVSMEENKEPQFDKEKLVLSMAHEIRSPLAAIKLANQLLQEGVGRDNADKLMIESLMKLIDHNVMVIDDYIKDLLSSKREILGGLKLVNLADCLDKAVCKAEDRLYLNGINLTRGYAAEYWILGNEEKLVIAFLNIIVNAIEAIKSGEGKIWINSYQTNGTVRLTFKDNGIGMEPGAAAKMFDRYVTSKNDGVGFGLFQVKEIMDIHEANIVADSLPNVGTSISIVFKTVNQPIKINERKP